MRNLYICFLVIVITLVSCAATQPRPPHEIHGIEVTTSLLPKNIQAITIYPFVFMNVSRPRTQALINHENIHLAQYKELLIVGFLVVYLCEYLDWLINVGYGSPSWIMALEQEAYVNQYDSSYLETRKAYAWWDY